MVLVATCLFGLESYVGKEIDNLGLKRINTIDGRVFFEGNERDLISANIYLRCAERVLILAGEFDAFSFEELFEKTKAVDFSKYIGIKDAFPVKGHSIKSKLYSIPDCQKIIKKAMVKSLSEKYNVTWFEETGVKFQIEFLILKDHVYLMIDTSGEGLHKRGYRKNATEAPLKETLASALVLTSRPREDVLFWDPMCGSGTIAIEAALIMTNTPPGLYRNFAFEEFPFINKKNVDEIRKKAKEGIVRNGYRVYASDIDEDSLNIARNNAKIAGVDDVINIFNKDALTIETNGMKGTVVCNPPYGERLNSLKSVEKLYKEMGKAFNRLDNWQIYILTNNEDFEKLYGRRADKKRKLYNGMIPCTLYEFFKKREAKK